MFEASFNLFTEMPFEIHSFGVSRLEEFNSELNPKLFAIIADFSKQEIGTSRLELVS